jgi:hypothetical protein
MLGFQRFEHSNWIFTVHRQGFYPM